MFATLADKPFDSPEWIFEPKWDGYRAIAEIRNNKVNLYSRNGLSFNEQFAAVAKALKEIDDEVVLDGEVVVENDKGKAEFQLLQNYKTNKKGKLVYYVFDILYLNGYDVCPLELSARRELLEALFDRINIPGIRLSPYISGKGVSLFEKAEKEQLEGIIAKKADSVYLPGKRTREWLKIKTILRQEVVICGYTEPRGGRKHLGALIIGLYKDGELVYAGHCGGGFNESLLQDTFKLLKPLQQKECPFRLKPKTNMPVNWVKPELVCEVKFSEWTKDGIMRHPVFLGMRKDKSAENVVAETPAVNTDKSETMDNELVIGRHKLKLTNLNKLYWPKEKITKGDLISYYREVADLILPYIKDRPQSLLRHPNGIEEPGFFQKDMKKNVLPSWIKTIPVYSESNDEMIDYLLCQNEATLVYMANLGCIEINPWLSNTKHLENPDYMVIDLDPEKIEFRYVVETAKEVKKLADELKLGAYCKTSGATGIHIYMPMGGKYNFDQVKDFAHLFAQEIHRRIPKFTSIERSPSKRQEKVYIDFLQNRKGQTLSAPYSARPKPGATVSTPLHWDELDEKLSPSNFTIFNITKRVAKEGDLWKNVTSKGADMLKAISLFEELKNQ